MLSHGIIYAILLNVIIIKIVYTEDVDEEKFIRLIGRCSRRAPDFDRCMKGVFNDLREYFPTGKFILIFIFKIFNLVFFNFFKEAAFV